MNLKVLFVNHAVELGGAELTLVGLLQDRLEGLQVTLAVPHEGPLAERARALGVRVELAGPGEGTLGYRRGAPSRSLLVAARAALETGPAVARLARLALSHDLVVTNSTKAHLYGALAARLAHVPCAWRLHDVIDEEGFSPVVRTLLLQAARTLPQRIVAVSEAAAAPVRAAGAKNVFVQPNGVDLSAMRAPEGARARIRTELCLPHDAPVVLLLGRLTPLKGAEVLFEALRELPGVYAVVAGEPTFSEVDDYGRVLRRAAEPVGDRVVFAGFRRDVAALLAASDVLAHPSVKPDSLPTAVLEAIAAGVPVVASTAGGAAEIIGGGEGGLLVPPRDARALREALRKVLDDRPFAARLSARGRRRALDFERGFATTRVWRRLLETLPP